MKWLGFVREVLSSAIEDDVLDWAATLSFYFLFAMFPAMLLLAALLAVFHLGGLASNLVVAFSRDLPRPAADLVSQQLQGLLQSSVPGLLSLDIILLLYAASRGFAGLMTALNIAYEVRETRPYWRQLLLSLELTFSAGVLILLTLIFLVPGQRLLIILAGPIHVGMALTVLWPVIRWAVTLSCMFFAAVMLYRYAPDIRRYSFGILPAVGSAMTLWVIASALLASYINNFSNYSVIYGSLGAVIGLMLWFYILALALLLGAEIHSTLLKRHGLSAEWKRAA